MTNKKSKVIFWCIAGIIFCSLVTILLSIIPITNKIDKTVAGIYFELNDDEIYEAVDITIDGIYKHYVLHLFHTDTFSGRFSVSNIKSTEEFVMFPVNFRDKEGSLLYSDVSPGSNKSLNLGNIRQNNKFSQGVVWGNQKVESENEYREYIISFPTQTREEAMLLACSLFSEFDFASSP